MTQIDVIRHGEPKGGRRYRGYGIDDPLTETGWQQMWTAMPDTRLPGMSLFLHRFRAALSSAKASLKKSVAPVMLKIK